MGSFRSSVRTQARLWRALLVAAAFLFVGCGGSDSDEAGRLTSTRAEATTGKEQASPSKQEYIAQGDAICAEIQADLAGLAQRAEELQAQSDELPEADFLARAAELWEDQIGLTEVFLRRLGELVSPPGDEAQVEQFLKSIEDGVATAREIQETLAGGKEIPQALAEEYGQTGARGNELARAYGFQVCGHRNSANAVGRPSWRAPSPTI
jgi:hypothetical protein